MAHTAEFILYCFTHPRDIHRELPLLDRHVKSYRIKPPDYGVEVKRWATYSNADALVAAAIFRSQLAREGYSWETLTTSFHNARQKTKESILGMVKAKTTI